MASYTASVVLDSINEADSRLTTMEITMQKSTALEFLTYRVISSSIQHPWGIPEDMVTIVATATEWDRFIGLLDMPGASSDIRGVADVVETTLLASEPQLAQRGDWHLPYLEPDERYGSHVPLEDLCRISAARCACGPVGLKSLWQGKLIYDDLIHRGRLPPLEHVAKPSIYWDEQVPHQDCAQQRSTLVGNYSGWQPLAQFGRLLS